MIALLIGYESVCRIFAPVPIHFTEAIPIACLGSAVNVASAWISSGGEVDHVHSHGHGHAHGSPIIRITTSHVKSGPLPA